MADLQAALGDALSGQGRLVMLAGEPGIGKTRTAQELAGYAQTLGVQVLWGRCYEEEGAPPYWPWLQLLRFYVQKQTPEQLQAEMGPGAADIAEIVPELVEKLPNLETPTALEPEQASFRLFDSITIFLKNASQSQPLMLVLDDLHWSDRSSLLLLEFLAREIQSSPLLVLGTYRDVEVPRRHPLSETLGSLIREQRFFRMQLHGLAENEVEQLIQRSAAVSLPPGLSTTIHQRTEGNPLFVSEIIRMLPGDGLAEDQGYLTSIPEGVRDAISRRLNRLSEGCNQVLATASVIGREFDFKLLSALLEDLKESLLLALVDEALEAHVIEELLEGRERYQFSHALIQETLLGEVSTGRKVRQHARIAGALEEIYGANVEAHAAELAYHCAEAQTVLGPDELVRYSLLAGEQALATYAWEDALGFERALEAKGEGAMDPEAADLLFGLGRAQAATLARHRISEAVETLSRALDCFAAAGEIERVVAVAEYPFYPLIGQASGNAQLIRRALALVSPESLQAGRLLSRYGRVMGIEEGDYQVAAESFAQALSIARKGSDEELEMRTLAEAANVDMLHLKHGESLEKNVRALELSKRIDAPYAEVLARYNMVLVLLAQGDLVGMRSQASALLAIAERLRDRFWLSMALRSNEDVAHLTGDWQTARSFSDRGLMISPDECRSLCTRAILDFQVGDVAHGKIQLKRLVEALAVTPPGPTNQHAFTGMAIPLVARAGGGADLFEVAEAGAQTVLASPAKTKHNELFCNMGLAMLSVCRNDSGGAREQYAALEPLRGSVVPFAMTAVDHVLGLLAQTMANLDQAVAHFEDALAFCRKAGYRPELAWTCYDYADTLFQRGVSGDREKAISLLDESLAISTELGMRPLTEKVTARRESLGSQPPRTIKYPSNMTKRQWEVLQHPRPR